MLTQIKPQSRSDSSAMSFPTPSAKLLQSSHHDAIVGGRAALLCTTWIGGSSSGAQKRARRVRGTEHAAVKKDFGGDVN
jgi:hypothetical protein